MITIMMIIMQI